MDNPLVSVVVAAYNSSATICETLDSIANQTYHNIELIVTDDCSKDNTIDIVSRWLDENGNRFFNTELVTVAQNTGTSANLNRAVKHSAGEWIKTVAADDRLNQKCISALVYFVKKNPCNFCICDLDVFCEDGMVPAIHEQLYNHYFDCVKESYEKKLARIIREYKLPGPGYFFTRKMYDDIGGFEEKYKLLEEWPFVYKALKKGYDIIPVDEKLVQYRVSSKSVSHTMNSSLPNRQIFLDKKNFFQDILRKEQLRNMQILRAWSATLNFFITDKSYYDISPLKQKFLNALHLFDPLYVWQSLKVRLRIT